MNAPGGRPFGVRSIEDLAPLEGRAVLVRATLELPMGAGGGSPVAALRLARLGETIRALRARGATVTVCGDTHPPGAEPDVDHDKQVAESIGSMGAEFVPAGAHGSVEDAGLLDELIRGHQAFVNDSFQWSYLALPSLVEPAGRLASAAGRGLEQDLRIASGLLERPVRPFAAVLGGADSMLRLHGLQGLVLRADMVLVGGAMSLPMLQAIGKGPHGRLPDGFLDECRAVIGLAERVRHQVHLPRDFVVRRPDGTLEVADPADSGEGDVVDIGPLTAKRFAELLRGADTVVWTGALGRVEEEPSAAGTLAVARSLEPSAQRRIVVGGDSLAAVLQGEHRLRRPIDLITATDSLLELIKSGDLPALRPLRG